MTLLKCKVVKNDREYIDLFLCWTYNDHLYKVRVDSVFPKDYKKLVSQAVVVPEGELLEKYV